jgi:hypothetical protein
MKSCSVLFALALSALALSACGDSDQAIPPAPFRIVHNQIVLTPQGAQRIGVQTQVAGRFRDLTTIPAAAVIYDPSGATYAFSNTAKLTYAETPVSIATISGGTAYLLHGPHPGSAVVTVGAEELYGVQTGVLAQT